jgi:WD40 repeat protein
VVTASSDGVVRVWSAGGKSLLAFRASDATQSDKRVVNDLTVSPDGNWIVTATADGLAKIWSASTGELLSVLTGDGSRVDHALFSPDGRHILTAGDGEQTRIWSTAAAAVVLAFGDSNGYCRHGSFSPDGTRMLVSGCDSGNSRVLSAANGQIESLLMQDGYPPPVFSPDGKQILAVDTLMDARGRILFRLTGHTNSIFHSEFSPDGTRIGTASRDKTARVWDAHTGRSSAILHHSDWVRAASFSSDGRLVVTACRDGAATVWNAATGEKVQAFQSEKSPLRCVSFSPDGRRIVTGSDDGKASVWSISGGRAGNPHRA